MGWQRLAVLASSILVGAVAVWWLIASILFGMRCDESCSDGPRGQYEPGLPWNEYYGSWQWTAQWACACIALASAFALRRAVRRRSWRTAAGSALVGVAAYVGWTLW